VHRLTADGAWWRFGYQQMAPMYNISSVEVVNGIVWVGSDVSGLARLSSQASAQQLDISVSGEFNTNAKENSNTNTNTHIFTDPDNDPWMWQYYIGGRYLPCNSIISLQTYQYSTSDSSVLAVTTAGIAFIHMVPWTLPEKAKAMQSFQSPRHDRHGLSTAVGLTSFGDVSQYNKQVQDNDGLWTAMGAIGTVYRYIVDNEEEARALAWYAFTGMERLCKLTPAYPKYAARTFCKMSDGDSGCPTSYDEVEPNENNHWYNGTEDGWVYKGDTSSDSISGHLAIYPMIYDHIAQSDSERERVLTLIEGLTGGIIENDFFLIDPETDKPTKWGYWAPQWLNDQPEYYSERGGNSLEILAWCASAYSITGKVLYKDTFWRLVNDHGYDKNVLNVKIDSCVDENHSDTELIMMAFHSMFYSLWRLDEHSTDVVMQQRYKDVKEMCEPIVPGLRRTWQLLKGEKSPLWYGIYAGTAKQSWQVDQEDRDGSTWSLRHWAIDMINWSILGSQRIDLDISSHPTWFHVRMNPGQVGETLEP